MSNRVILTKATPLLSAHAMLTLNNFHIHITILSKICNPRLEFYMSCHEIRIVVNCGVCPNESL